MFILSQAWSTDTVQTQFLPSWLVNNPGLETGEIKFTERPFHSFISLQRIQDSHCGVLAMEIDPACPGAGARFHNKNSCALERSICSLSSKWNICITSLQLDVMATVFTKKQQKCKREQGGQLLWEHEGSQTQIHLVEITPRSFPWHISGAASQAERASPTLSQMRNDPWLPTTLLLVSLVSSPRFVTVSVHPGFGAQQQFKIRIWNQKNIFNVLFEFMLLQITNSEQTRPNWARKVRQLILLLWFKWTWKTGKWLMLQLVTSSLWSKPLGFPTVNIPL